MCDSNISVSCPADFTNYCPVNSLCDEGIRPYRRRQRKSKPVSNVKSHIAWFSHKAKGETANSNRPRISSQPRIVPLGADCECGGSKHTLSHWSFSSSDEEIADSRNKFWTHKYSKKSVSREELDAMRGCVKQRRALFSPSPSSSPCHSSGIDHPFKSQLGKTSPGHTVGKTRVNETVLRCNSLPLPQVNHGNSHFRQKSLEYDHLENFSSDASNPLGTKRKVIPDSVSVQFGPAGYECKAIRETDQSFAERAISQSTCKVPFATATSHMSVSAADVDCCIKKCERDCSYQCCHSHLSHSIPCQLDSSGLDHKHSMARCTVCQCLLCGVSQSLRDPAISRISHHQTSTCNSWPRSQICSTSNSASPLIGDGTIPKKHSVQTKSQACACSPFHSPQQSPHHSPRMLRMRYSKLNAPQLKKKEVGEVSNLGVCKDVTELGSTQSVCSCHSHQSISTTTSSWCDRPHNASNKGVEGSLFKDRSDMMLSWFAEFNDQQRNVLLLRFLEQCNCAQMHFLSVHMEPILHAGCPHNCEDLLSWLPETISTHILSFLDPVSLCQASQVNRAWYRMTSQPNLWKAFCKISKWQLSVIGEANQMQKFTLPDKSVQWKPMFAERFRLRRNWLKGYCNVRTFEGHTQGISCIQFDGTRIVSGSWDKTIKVWNRRTNTAWAALTLAGHSGTVRCLHLHGNRLVSGSSDRTIKVWDLSTDKVGWVGAACRATMVGHMHTVRCLQADNEKVISGSYDQTLKVWDIKTGYCRSTLRGHTDAVLCLQFDDVRVVSGSKDTTIKVWSLPDGVCEMTLHGHQAAVTCLQFDESRIVSGALDRFIKIWNRIDGKCIRTIDWIRSEGHTGVVRHLQVDRWKIVSAADDKTLKVWSVHTGDRLLTLKSHTDGVTCLQFSDDVIVSGSYDKTVKLWDFSAC